jgi:hypothetical protein
MKTSIVATEPSSSQPSLPVSMLGSRSGDGVGPFGGWISQAGQKEFHCDQVVVSLMRLRTDNGDADTLVLARTAKDPPEPWVGTGIGGTTEHVTGEADVTGAAVGGYIGILKLDLELSSGLQYELMRLKLKVGLGIKVQRGGLEDHS